MAEVETLPDVSARIDSYLAYLLDVMDDVLEIAEEWETWDDYEQLDFVIEWDIKRDRLFQLERWDRLGPFTVDQQRRYRRLLDVMDERRPILDRLLAD